MTKPHHPKTGTLIVLTGPSGVGKGTLRKQLLTRLMELKDSVSATTRPIRPGEQDGVDYFFVTHPQFEAMIANQELVEWAEYAGNYYGTPKAFLQDTLNKGESVILEIEVQGALQIRELFPNEALMIFIAPPSLDVLEARLRGRDTNHEEDIQRRLSWAVKELEQQSLFDHVIVNDQLDRALEELSTLVQSCVLISPQKSGGNVEATSVE